MAKKQKIAILGGGMAGIVAAYELTDTPALRERYDVTVYQFGWRLGGKCASGRNPRHHQRIEEHGLHVWFGFYENAFRVMRDAYTELGRDPSEPLATWRDAFKPCDDIVLYEEWDGRWRGWSFAVPRNLLTPGDATALPQFWEVAHTMLAYLLARWGSLATTRSQVSPGVSAASGLRLPSLPFGMALPFGLSRVAANAWSWLLRQWASAPELVLREALARADRWRGEELGSPAEVAEREFLLDAIDAFKEWLWRFVVSPNLDDDELRLFFTQFDVGATILEGIIEDGLIEGGFDVVNNEDLRKWLRRHGAREITVDQSPFVRSLYDMAFAYKDGDINQPDMAAGTAVHDMLRLFFTYRGAFTWKMQAGMGDTVFTPFYEVLRRRGVRFEYFSWITRLGLSADKRSVDSIEFIPQAFLKAREHRPPGLEGHNLSKWLWETEYKPLVSVDGLGCWPSVPDFDQLLDGDELEDRK